MAAFQIQKSCISISDFHIKKMVIHSLDVPTENDIIW